MPNMTTIPEESTSPAIAKAPARGQAGKENHARADAVDKNRPASATQREM